MRKTKSLSPNGRKTQRHGNSPRRINLIADADEIERIFHQAVQHELSIHKRLGNPIAIWKDGKVVIIPPEEILLDDPAGEPERSQDPDTSP